MLNPSLTYKEPKPPFELFCLVVLLFTLRTTTCEKKRASQVEPRLRFFRPRSVCAGFRNVACKMEKQRSRVYARPGSSTPLLVGRWLSLR